MSSKRNAPMIVGISMGQEICLTLGQVSLDLLYWMKNLPTDICGPGEINEKTAYIQARSSMARALEINGKHSKLKEKQKWFTESSIKRTHENCKGSISLTRKIRNSKRPSRMLVKNWEHLWLLLCLAKSVQKNCGTCGSKIETGLACNLEVDESARLRMGENHCQIIMKTLLQENSLQNGNSVHKFIPTPQAMKSPAAKAAVDKEWDKLEKKSAWNLTKVRSKQEVIDEAKKNGENFGVELDKNQKQIRGDRWSKDVGRDAISLGYKMLFLGYKMLFFRDTKNCSWHFRRSKAARVCFSHNIRQEQGGPNAGRSKPRTFKAKRCGAPKGGVEGEEGAGGASSRGNSVGCKFCLNWLRCKGSNQF